MSTQMRNYQNIEVALHNTRKDVRRTIAPIRHILDASFSLYLNFIELVRNWTRAEDQETYALGVAATIARRVIAAVSLLESGLAQEAQIVLRNALELTLILIDIIHNEESLSQWKKTGQDDLRVLESTSWYFRFKRVLERIGGDEKSIYPQPEIEISAIIEQQWQLISNMTVHAHSYAQINTMIDQQGNFQLLGRKTVEAYLEDFQQLSAMLFNVVSILMAVPKYHDNINHYLSSDNKVQDFLNLYKRIQSRYDTDKKIDEGRAY